MLNVDLATQGADRLSTFLEGINATRSDDTNVTLLGHSYGSLTSGLALQDPHTGVDNAVLFGSPGFGVETRDQLHVENLYAQAARGDVVADANGWNPGFGGSPADLDDVTWLSTDETSHGPQQRLAGAEWHTHYIDRGTTSQYDQALVTVGADGSEDGPLHITDPPGKWGHIGGTLDYWGDRLEKWTGI